MRCAKNFDLTFRHPRAGGDPEITVSLWTPACAGVTKNHSPIVLAIKNERSDILYEA